MKQNYGIPVLPSGGWTILGLVQHLTLDVERFLVLGRHRRRPMCDRRTGQS
jgi:hypothetical protein